MSEKSAKQSEESLLDQIVHPHAAGVDVGSRELVVALPDRGPGSVRTFPTHNKGLRELVDWLKENHIRTLAMESTSNYWVALYDFAETAGIEPCLVNARHAKNLPGRKTDVSDARWIQRLHAAGLLRPSFVPTQDVRTLRYLHRHRECLVRSGTREIQLMQKVLTEMNVGLHHVISDIDGLSGMRIINAILDGERDPERLAALRHTNCRTPREEVVRALDGNFRDEYMLVLRQARDNWGRAQEQIEEVDVELKVLLKKFEPEKTLPGKTCVLQTEFPDLPEPKSKKRQRISHDLVAEAKRIYATDLSLIPGVSSEVLAALLTEIGGRDAFVEKFKTGRRFTSWLGLCPDNRISGNKRLGAKTRRVKSRVAAALRIAASTLWRGGTELGNYCLRIKGRLGKPEGITAGAHKIARIIFSLIVNGGTYDDAKVGETTEAKKRKHVRNLQRKARKLGYELVEVEAETTAAAA